MNDRRKDELGVPEALPIEELIARSSIGGEMDPELDDVCTDDDAEGFIAQLDARQQDAPTDSESPVGDDGGERRPRHRLAEPQRVSAPQGRGKSALLGFMGLSAAGRRDARASAARLREELASFACAPALGWTSLIGTLLEQLRQMVNRSDFFNFYSRFEESRFFVVNDLLPPPCLSPVSEPHVPGARNRRVRIDDDAALVLDTSLAGGSGVPTHEVYWPSQVDEDHQEFYYRLLDAFYRVDLAPHCHLSAIQPTCVLSSATRTLALLWRVVVPSRAMAMRDQNFVELLERGLASWRPQFQQLISRDEDVPTSLLSALANDRYWATLGLRVSAQLCTHRENGELDNFLSTTSWHFLTDALQDKRRWFPFVDRAIRAHAGSDVADSEIPEDALGRHQRPGDALVFTRSSDDTQALYPIANPLRCGPNRDPTDEQVTPGRDRASQEGPPRRGKFELYTDAQGKYRFRLKAGNGQIIATGEAYDTKDEVLRAVDRLKSTMPPDDASASGHQDVDRPYQTLTPQERKILDLIAHGLPNHRIAQQLYLSETTVGRYVSTLLHKLGFECRADVEGYARRRQQEQGVWTARTLMET